MRDTFDIEQLPTSRLLQEWLSVVHKPNAKSGEVDDLQAIYSALCQTKVYIEECVK